MVLRQGQINRVKAHLLPGEKALDIAFPSRLAMARWYIAAIALLIVAVASYRVPIATLYITGVMQIVFMGAAALLLTCAEIKRHTELLVITSTRVIHLKGILSKEFTDVALTQISDTSYAQDFLGLLFRYGIILINTPGSPHAEIVLRGISYPDKRKKLIDSLIEITKPAQQQRR